MTDILTLPHDAIATRVWQGTTYAYPNIERLIAELTNLRARVAELEAQVEDMDRQRCAAMKAAHVARRIGEKAADALQKCRDAMTREAWQEGASIAEAGAAAAGAICVVELFSDTDYNLKIRALLDHVAELKAQVAARDEAVRVLAELYLARHDACESAHGLNLFASPAALTRLVHAIEAGRGNPIAIAAITDAKNKEQP